jgi:hypothetical protein
VRIGWVGWAYWLVSGWRTLCIQLAMATAFSFFLGYTSPPTAILQNTPQILGRLALSSLFAVVVHYGFVEAEERLGATVAEWKRKQMLRRAAKASFLENMARMERELPELESALEHWSSTTDTEAKQREVDKAVEALHRRKVGLEAD